MTLRGRLALHYGAVVAVALLVLAGLYTHERWTEARLREALPAERKAEAQRGDPIEVIVYALIPVILATGWWITRRSLRPLDELAAAVERTDVDSLRRPLPRSHNGDEVDRLAAAFGRMSSRLDHSFRQVREFTLHASHELKTPLTVMRAEVESALQDQSPCPPAHAEALHGLATEIERLTRIVDGLTLLTKADAGLVDLQMQPVGLAELVEESAEDALVLAEPHGIAVTLERCDDATVSGSRDRLRQLLLNLVDNAVKYNVQGGRVALRLTRRESVAEITIENTGAGVPDELAPRVFERFVRGDEARRNAVEGCGLGLSIAQWVVHAHGGTIDLASRDGMTVVTVRLPLLAPADSAGGG